MDQKPNVSIDNSSKPSRLLALIALIIAFCLPFILVKTFPHKKASNIASSDLPSSFFTPIEQRKPLTADDLPVIPSMPTAEEISKAIVHSTYTSQLEKVTQEQSKPSKTVNLQIPTSTKLAKEAAAVAKTTPDNELKIVKTREKDSLSAVFKRAGVSPQTLKSILKNNPHSRFLTNRLKANQDIQFQIRKQTLEKLLIPYNTTQYFVVYLDKGRYKTTINNRKMTSQNRSISATVQGSLYGTAKRMKIAPKLIQQMTEIFTWDIDFAKDVRAGDHFVIIYKEYYVDGKLVSIGDIQAVSYQNRGKIFEAIRHTDRFGQAEYYTPQGMSLKKAFTRYPIRFSHISSSFSLARYHPILHYMRAHKGVDLAARIGTPIMATGSGRIEFIGRQNGYGNMIKINHDAKYSTIYGHMLKFEKGLSKGDYVKRGQIIGYVGQTGLASGPHCHYEFHINGQPKNPTTVDLPRGLSITGRELATFKANTNSLLSQLKTSDQNRVAVNNTGKTHNKRARA